MSTSKTARRTAAQNKARILFERQTLAAWRQRAATEGVKEVSGEEWARIAQAQVREKSSPPDTALAMMWIEG